MYHNRAIRLDESRQQTLMNPDGTITVYVPVTFKREGGRNFIMTPTEPVSQFEPPKEHEPLINGVLKAFTWKEMLEEGTVNCLREIAVKEKISESFICRMFRLTLLAPDIIEAILDGRQPKTLTLGECLKPFPVEWEAQRIKFGFKVAEV